MTQVNIKKPGKTSGYSGDIVCKYCGKVFQKGEILPATEAGDAKLSATKYTYNGKTHQPTVTVDDMTLNKDYTVK